MVNPFAKRRKEAIAAAIVPKEKEEESKKEEKPVQAKQESSDDKPAVKKVNPFLKKKQAKKEEETVPVDIEPNPDEDPALLAVADEPESEVPATKPKRRSRKKKEESKQEEPPKEEKQEEPAPEEEMNETAAEAEATEEQAPEAEAENEMKAVAPKKKRGTKKDPDQKRAEKIIMSDYGDIFKSELSVEESAKFVLEAYQSDEFRTFKKDIYARMEDVTIDPDMNPGTIRYKLHCIDALKMELMPLKVNTREALNSLMQKDYGVLTAYIAEHSVGSNDLERRRNGCLSLAKFECKGQQINMLTTMTGVKMRDEFLDAVLSELKTKQEVLITYLGTLKVDSNLMPPDIVPER